MADFVWVFPLVFASSLYVPWRLCWLASGFRKINKVTSIVDKISALSLGTDVLPTYGRYYLGGVLLLVFNP